MEINEKHEKSWKYYVFRIILLIIYFIFLFELFKILINYGASPLLAFALDFFALLFFIGFLVKGKGNSFFSRFKHKKINLKDTDKKKKEEYLKQFKKYHPQLRRIDKIDLNKKYRKPIVRKCSNCGIILPGFVKKCPNCGENIIK
ncbi:MAG: hypothetical protein ACTSRI_08150 [Promethearchaeota archaeon]